MEENMKKHQMSKDYAENALIEKPAIELFEELGWRTKNCYNEFMHAAGSPLDRDTKAEVIVRSRLRPMLEQLNRNLPPEAFEQAILELTRDRSAMSPVHANREIYHYLKNGIKVKIPDAEGEGEIEETVHIIDWETPENNDFFLASQFWITGDVYTRRADLVGFVNGLPLVFIELKASHKTLETAYTKNLSDYKDTIPHVFWYNAFIILSNGSQSKVGTITAGWEHFADWKKINDEGEEGIISLDTMIRGLCDKKRLLDLVENFILFKEVKGGLAKMFTKNHQYLGVNNVIKALKDIKSRKGRLGVFWHTQGSGKSISMIFFSQKVLRKIHGNWTFVIVTDRKDLDEQIYKKFARTGVITKKKIQAENSTHLRQLLREDHRYVFTLIQKFRTEKLEKHPVLSKRSDIIVITDEAHRTQYDTFALNMRTALPNASFIAFTGTPLIEGEEKTKEVFGDYVSIYNFKESVDDEATVPLYYENRIPELELTNEQLNEEIYQIVEEAQLDEEQELKVEREFSRQYQVITRDDRLEAVAKDIVTHFMGRGFRGKAMVVSIDKATTLRMYNKIQKYWKEYITQVQEELDAAPWEKRKEIKEKLRYMEETDMAVVVSESQNEVEEMRKKGLDIIPHRKRMIDENLDEKFKDEDDPFRIVFLCAMWMTGFDVPSCSTIYLDKPLRNHTLMQTIARANRVFGKKSYGLIVDYMGVFRNLQKALAIYGSEYGGGIKPGDTPIKPKSALVEQLRQAIDEVNTFCEGQGIDLDAIQVAEKFELVNLLDDTVDAIVVNDETKRNYFSLVGKVSKLYRAILPDPAANEFAPRCALFEVIAQKIRSLTPPADISEVMEEIEHVLDESVITRKYVIPETIEPYSTDHLVDLSQIDFEALKAKFEKSRKHIEVEKLRGAIHSKLEKMVRLNRTRVDYMERFQEMIEEYNDGSKNTDEIFKWLVDFAQSLNEEEQRSIKEQLSEEELTIFDILTKPDIQLSKDEKQQVKKVARELVEILKKEKFVLDWRKRQQTRAAVRLAVEEILDGLPQQYTPDLFQEKCDLVYNHVYDSYYGMGQSVYSDAV
jgi:type I restriction enzyme R subunit